MYSKEDTEILKMCFGNIIYLLANDIYTLEEISNYCGNQLIDGEIKPLITPEELKTMEVFNAIVIMPRMMPFKTKLLPDYQIDWGYEKVIEESVRLFEEMADTSGTLWEYCQPLASCNHGFAAYAMKWIIYALTGYDCMGICEIEKNGLGIDCKIRIPKDIHGGKYVTLCVKNNIVTME